MDIKIQDNKKLAELACSGDVFVTTLALMAISKLGLECLDWEPEVVTVSFESEFGIPHLPQRACDKLQTGLMLIGTNAFTNTLEGFLAGIKVMNNRVFDETEAPYCTIAMCGWGVTEYMLLMGETDGKKPLETFSADIIGYIQQAAAVNGIYKLPECLSFADSGNLPDLSGDIDQFEMYTERQAEYGRMIDARIAEKQAKLNEQLAILKQYGIISENA